MARREEGDALWQAPAPVAGRGAYTIRALPDLCSS
jgi:hypothetical protein